MDRRAMRSRGFTLLETVMGAGLFVLLLSIIATGMATESQTHRVLVGNLGPDKVAADALERMVADLRLASVLGEDKDGNGVLGAGEDQNGNGVLDADWRVGDETEQSLPWTEPRSSIRFNRRMDETDVDGNVIATGIYSGAIGYRLAGDRLLREWTANGAARSTVLAQNILGFRVRFDPATRLVTVSMDVRLPPRVYKTDRRTLSASVWLRN